MEYLQYTVIIPHIAMVIKKEKQVHRSAQKEGKVRLHQVLERTLRGHSTMAMKRFASARRPTLLILALFPKNQGHITHQVGCIVFMTAGKGWYPMTSLKNSQIANPEKVRYNVIGVEMKGMKSSMKLVALGAKVRQVW